MEPGPKPGEYRILVLPGLLDLTAGAPGRVNTSLLEEQEGGTARPPVLEPGQRWEGVLRLPESGSVKVFLRCNGRLLDGEKVDPLIVTGDGVRTSTSWGMNGAGGLRERDGVPPGQYLLVLKDPAGDFKPLPDREIVVRPGKTTEITLNLVRLK